MVLGALAGADFGNVGASPANVAGGIGDLGSVLGGITSPRASRYPTSTSACAGTCWAGCAARFRASAGCLGPILEPCGGCISSVGDVAGDAVGAIGNVAEGAIEVVAGILD